MIIPYTIDLNTERCIYQELNRTYKITAEDGHSYSGPPAKITVTLETVSYDDKQGTILDFSAEKFAPFFVRGSIGHDTLPLTDLSFESIFPNLTDSQQIRYNWPPLGLN